MPQAGEKPEKSEQRLGEYMINFVNDLKEDLKIRQINETQDTLEKELFDVNFKLQFDKGMNNLIIYCFLFALVLFLKIIGKPLLKMIIYGEAFNLSSIHIVCLCLVGLVFILLIVAPLYIKNKPLPEINKSMMYYRKQSYHFSQISKITISRFSLTTVYLDEKKKFMISRDFINYDAFIQWAKKCNVPIEQNQKPDIDMTEEQITKLTAIIVVVIIIIVLLLFAAGIF